VYHQVGKEIKRIRKWCTVNQV